MEIELMNGQKRKIAFAYIKGYKYDKYSFSYEGDSELKEVEKEFEEFEQLMQFVYQFSDYYDIPIQFYI